LQPIHRVGLPTVSFAVFLLLACIPPPAGSQPSAPKPAAKAPASAASPAPAAAAECILNSLSLFAITLPLPQQGTAVTNLLDSLANQQRAASAAAAAAREAKDDDERWVPPNTELVDTARTFTGVRYRWAGMSSRGMDCSGLIARVLKSHGIRAPHNAAQLFKLGTPIQRDDLQPGDLIFFNTRGSGISHVGMYIGDDRFIHASSRAGQVTTNCLSDSYYTRHYRGARRLDKPADSR